MPDKMKLKQIEYVLLMCTLRNLPHPPYVENVFEFGFPPPPIVSAPPTNRRNIFDGGILLKQRATVITLRQ